MNDSSLLIREFLSEHFSDEEIVALCFDNFQAVSNDFSAGLSKRVKIQRLIEYCQAREQFPQLVQALNDARPGQLDSYRGAGAKDLPPPTAKRAEALMSEAIRLERTGNLSGALEIFERIKQIDPHCPGLTTHLSAVQREMKSGHVARWDKVRKARIPKREHLPSAPPIVWLGCLLLATLLLVVIYLLTNSTLPLPMLVVILVLIGSFITLLTRGLGE